MSEAPTGELRDTPSPELGLFPSHYSDLEEKRSQTDAEPKSDDGGPRRSRNSKTTANRKLNEMPSEVNVTHRRPKTRRLSRFSPASVIRKSSPKHTRPPTTKHSLWASTAPTASTSATISPTLKIQTLDELFSVFSEASLQSEFVLPTVLPAIDALKSDFSLPVLHGPPVTNARVTTRCLASVSQKVDMEPVRHNRLFADKELKELTVDARRQIIFSLRIPSSEFELPLKFTLTKEPLVINQATSAQIPTTSAASACNKASTSGEPLASTKGLVRPRRGRKRRQQYSPEHSPRKAMSTLNQQVEHASATIVCDVAEPTGALTDTAEKQEENEPMEEESLVRQPQEELCNADHAMEVQLPSMSPSSEASDDGSKSSQGTGTNIVDNKDAEPTGNEQPASSNGAAGDVKPRFQIHPAMFLRENASPQKHNLFDERKALFSKEDEERLNGSVLSLPPDSDSDSETNSEEDLNLTAKLEKYRDPEFRRQNPELEGAAMLLSDPKLLAQVKNNTKTIRDQYRGRRAMLTSDEKVYLLSEASDAANDLAPLERLVLSHPHSEIHHEARDHLLNALYQLNDKPRGDANREGLPEGPEKKADEKNIEAAILEPKSPLLPFATVVPVLRFLCQTDVFPRNISDVLAQSSPGSRKKSAPARGQLTPRNAAPSNESRTSHMTEIDRVQTALRETSDPVDEELRTELLLSTLKTVVEFLPLFDLDEWTSSQIAALLFALARIYVDVLSDAGLNCAIEKAFHEILDKQYTHKEPAERASVVLTKFTKLFPHVDNAVGGLFVLMQRIFLRVPSLRAHRIKALAEVVAYLSARQPMKSEEDSSQIDQDRLKTREWKLPNDFFEIYSNLPHIYEHLANAPNQLYMVVQIMNIVVSKRALEPIGIHGLYYMQRQQRWANLCLKKAVFDHLIIIYLNRASEEVEDVYTFKKNDLTYLVNGKDDDDELPDLSDDE